MRTPGLYGAGAGDDALDASRLHAAILGCCKRQLKDTANNPCGHREVCDATASGETEALVLMEFEYDEESDYRIDEDDLPLRDGTGDEDRPASPGASPTPTPTEPLTPVLPPELGTLTYSATLATATVATAAVATELLRELGGDDMLYQLCAQLYKRSPEAQAELAAAGFKSTKTFSDSAWMQWGSGAVRPE